MDKSYKSLWVNEVKARMKDLLPEFDTVAIPKQHIDREIFVGTLLYRKVASADAVLWLTWRPGPGVERYFSVLLGWSPSADRLPCIRQHDRRLYSLRGPTWEFDAASLDLEQIEGKAGIGGIVIPSPWDQLLSVKAAAPKKEQDAVMRKAFAEANLLTEAERAAAVSDTVAQTMRRVTAVLPSFHEQLLSQNRTV